MRVAQRLGVVDEYELTAVADNGFAAGGVRNSAVPNYVYRWTEREVEKTIASAAPQRRHRFVWFRELELPVSVLELGGKGQVAVRGGTAAARDEGVPAAGEPVRVRGVP